jgi:hypothetical protein
MRLDQIAVRLRARSPYEAIDLGYAMTRAWWRQIFPAWISVYLTVGVIINLLCYAHPLVAVFIMWWLKPAFDRVVLHTLAGATYGAAPNWRETWRALPKLWWGNGLFASLTWRRLAPSRTFNLAVTQLERQFGKSGRLRREALSREGSGPAMMLMFVSLHFELLIWMSIYVFAELFTPGGLRELTWQSFFVEEPSKTQAYISNAVGMTAVLILEPFFVAAGFALYLHARTALEGWDIEQAFRLMDTRLTAEKVRHDRGTAWAAPIKTPRDSAQTTRQSAVLGVIAMIAVTGIFIGASLITSDVLARASASPKSAAPLSTTPIAPSASDASAATTTEHPPDPGLKQTEVIKSSTPDTGAKEEIENILSEPEFGEEQKTWRIKYVGPEREEEKRKPNDLRWLKKVGEFIGVILRALAWIAGISVALVFIYYLVKYLNGQDWRGLSRDKDAQIDMLFGLDVRPESLPESVADAARAAHARGDTRTALSLLYRGALVWLIQDGRIDIAKGDTEGICARHVANQYGGSNEGNRGSGATKPAYFAALVNTWQRVAYARQTPADAEITSLIDRWSAHFQLANKAAPSSTTAPAAAGA